MEEQFICANIEQSKELVKAGLKKETADMLWWYADNSYYLYPIDDRPIDPNAILTWSLGKLLDLMPKKIEKDGIYYRVIIEDTVMYFDITQGLTLVEFGEKPTLMENIIDCIKWLQNYENSN